MTTVYKVAQLRDMLAKVPDEAIVVLACGHDPSDIEYAHVVEESPHVTNHAGKSILVIEGSVFGAQLRDILVNKADYTISEEEASEYDPFFVCNVGGPWHYANDCDIFHEEA